MDNTESGASSLVKGKVLTILGSSRQKGIRSASRSILISKCDQCEEDQQKEDGAKKNVVTAVRLDHLRSSH